VFRPNKDLGKDTTVFPEPTTTVVPTDTTLPADTTPATTAAP